MAEPVQLRIDLASPVPAYRQIVDGIRALLVEGAVPPDSVLPPVRELALDLSVHFNTVAEAYRVLAEEGWLDLKRRLGARVLPRLAPVATPGQCEGFTQRLRELVAGARAEGLATEDIVRELKEMVRGLK